MASKPLFVKFLISVLRFPIMLVLMALIFEPSLLFKFLLWVLLLLLDWVTFLIFLALVLIKGKLENSSLLLAGTFSAEPGFSLGDLGLLLVISTSSFSFESFTPLLLLILCHLLSFSAELGSSLKSLLFLILEPLENLGSANRPRLSATPKSLHSDEFLFLEGKITYGFWSFLLSALLILDNWVRYYLNWLLYLDCFWNWGWGLDYWGFHDFCFWLWGFFDWSSWSFLGSNFGWSGFLFGSCGLFRRHFIHL